VYGVGDKLPSIRSLHRDLGLSISTVYKAFVELESAGVVQARPKSGYFVCEAPLARVPPPQAAGQATAPRDIRVLSLVRTIMQAMGDPGLLSFGSSSVSSGLLPHKFFARTLKQLPAHEMQSLISYVLPEGHPDLRRRLAHLCLGQMPVADPDGVIVTGGCTEAVTLALQAVVRRGHTVALETPTYFGYLQLLKELGIKVVEVPADPVHGLDVAALHTALGRYPIKACLFMPNFQNPLGALMPDEKKRELVGLLNRKGIPLIEDNIFSELYFGAQRPRPLKAYDKKDLVIFCSSFSKTIAPGLRVGWCIPGKRFRERIASLKAVTTLTTPTLSQFLIARFLEGGAYARHMRTLRAAVGRQVLNTARAVERHFPQGTRLAAPRGGTCLWVQLPPGADSGDLTLAALDHGISILPGAACSTTTRFSSYVRLGCGYPFTPEREQGVITLGALAAELVQRKKARPSRRT